MHFFTCENRTKTKKSTKEKKNKNKKKIKQHHLLFNLKEVGRVGNREFKKKKKKKNGEGKKKKKKKLLIAEYLFKLYFLLCTDTDVVGEETIQIESRYFLWL